ncbi:MAG: single-stranded-DNA-specific exonuclease RecJ [Rhodospirillaceae bacterium]|nr:single-stranded-DNA-specific exonuclease RecJ [Rhodospirillaceae bacterium]
MIIKSYQKNESVLGVEDSVKKNTWKFRLDDERAALSLSQRLDVPEIIGRIIASRNISMNEVHDFLSPKLKNLLPDPYLIKDMEKATKRIVEAIFNKEKISVFGDYDVDGATSSALLVRYFRSLNIEIMTYIPDRLKEGYGPTKNSINKLYNLGSNVLITVDCGTTSFDPIEQASHLGIDLIVLDHHKSDIKLPLAYAIVNPNRIDDENNNLNLTSLAAVGVTFMLIVSLNRELQKKGYFKNINKPDLRVLLDLVALGTICDLVPLKNLNRAFVLGGLKIMKKNLNYGIKALTSIGKITEELNSYHLGYVIGPRLNAGGRVGNSELGLKILETESEEFASKIAIKLDELNTERKELENKALQEAINIIQAKNFLADEVLIVFDKNWHLGVLGIVASRLVEKYQKPAIVLSEVDNVLKGSGRSVSGFDLGQNIINAKNSNILLTGGGHSMAAGLSLDKTKIDELKQFLVSSIKNKFPSGEINNFLYIDSIINLEAANEALINLIEDAGPFGSGNPVPRFLLNNVKLTKAFVVGKDHVSCIFKGGSSQILKAIAFRTLSEDLGRVLLSSQGKYLHVVGQLRNNSWNGRVEPQLIIEDIVLA